MSTEKVIEESLESVEVEAVVKRPSRVLKVITGVGEAYKFAWYTCLGTAVTVEEKVAVFGKKMADKGSQIDLKSQFGISSKLEAPKAKLTTAREELKTKAHETIVDVEQALDKGVNRSLHFIGVPSRKDMDQMTSLMKDMADSITELSSQLQDQKSVPAASRAKKPKTDSQTTAA